MYCPECGMQFPDDASFCPRCGRYVSFQGNTYVQPETQSAVTYTTSDYTADYPENYRTSGKRNYGTILAVILIAVMVIAVVYFPFHAEKGELHGRSFSHPYDGTYTDAEYKITYSWEYLDGDFGFDIPVPKDALAYYKTKTTYPRALDTYSQCTGFVEDTYGVSDKVLESLKAMYLEAFGADAPLDGQKYADFILAYVQGAFSYQTDYDQYRQEEYFAYPVETLCYKGGDCEDTSILCAMLYKLAGFRTAILIVPEHAMVGVSLIEYVTPDLGGGEILKAVSNGLTYYAGETTVDGFQPVGVNHGTHNNKYYSQWIYSAKIGQDPEYIFYEVAP